MLQQIVVHTEHHETIACPHCEAELCTLYPAPHETGEACMTTAYVTGQDHVIECGRCGPCLGCGTDDGEVCICGHWVQG